MRRIKSSLLAILVVLLISAFLRVDVFAKSLQIADENASSSSPDATQKLQAHMCVSRVIRSTMQSIENDAIQDPNGAALQFLAAALTGVNASANSAEIIDSASGSDGGRHTSQFPGSFICRGLFIRSNVRITSNSEDAESQLSAAAIQRLTTKYPAFTEFFIVKPLEEDTYTLTLLPSSIELSQEYSKTFTYADR
jgi:hypothetical protein